MILLLNDSLWHPLPDRADERFVQEAFARFKIDAPTEPLFADDDLGWLQRGGPAL